MATASTHFKLGLLAIVAMASAIAVAFGLGMQATRRETVSYHTYFDESVQGLELGAPVKYRGMPIGSVADIRIAPDHERVDVALAIDAPEARRLNLARAPANLRTQLGTQGITGVKLVDIDLFDPATNPAPVLRFSPGENYIPAAPSLLKGLGDNLGFVVQRLPRLVDTTTTTLEKLELNLNDFREERIPGRLGKALDDVDGVVVDLRTVLRHADRARIPEKTAAAVDALSAAIARVDAMVDRIGGDAGLVASTQRATESVGELGRVTSGSAQELERTLRDLDEAAQAIRDLAQGIERDPDMLVKGRERERPR